MNECWPGFAHSIFLCRSGSLIKSNGLWRCFDAVYWRDQPRSMDWFRNLLFFHLLVIFNLRPQGADGRSARGRISARCCAPPFPASLFIWNRSIGIRMQYNELPFALFFYVSARLSCFYHHKIFLRIWTWSNDSPFLFPSPFFAPIVSFQESSYIRYSRVLFFAMFLTCRTASILGNER